MCRQLFTRTAARTLPGLGPAENDARFPRNANRILAKDGRKVLMCTVFLSLSVRGAGGIEPPFLPGAHATGLTRRGRAALP